MSPFGYNSNMSQFGYPPNVDYRPRGHHYNMMGYRSMNPQIETKTSKSQDENKRLRSQSIYVAITNVIFNLNETLSRSQL